MIAARTQSFCLIGLLYVAGCAHQLRFRVVDTPSGRPVAGASAKITKITSFSYFSRQPDEREVGSADANGFITVPGLRRKDVVYFSAPGYRGASAGFVGRRRVGIAPYPPANPDRAYLDQKVVNRDAPVVIFLMPLSPP